MIYQWDARNAAHIAEHGVQPFDAEYVVDHARPPYPREVEDEKQLVWGQTASGRYLRVIFLYLEVDEVELHLLTPVDQIRFAQGEDEVVYIIHARELEDGEKRQLRRRARRRQ